MSYAKTTNDDCHSPGKHVSSVDKKCTLAYMDESAFFNIEKMFLPTN